MAWISKSKSIAFNFRSSSTTSMILFLVMFVPSVTPKPKFEVISDQPVIMGSNITFTTILTGPEVEQYDIVWHELSEHSRTQQGVLSKQNGYKSIFILSYPAENDTSPTSKYVNPGTYTVSATVSYDYVFFRITVGTQLGNYNVTSNFQGSLNAVQPGIIAKGPYISTKNETSLEVQLHDPRNYLKEAVNVTWSWYNNTGGFMTNTSTPILKKNITASGEYVFNVTLTAIYNSTLHPNSTFLHGGFFESRVVAKVPVVNFTVNGETWFPHGKLLNLKVEFDGTPPFTYCTRLYNGPYNMTGNETCERVIEIEESEFRYTRYFNEPGVHSLVMILENDVSRFVNRTLINVYKVGKKQPISIIIVPITCSLLALVMIIFGIAYFWENRARFNVEVADFDFGQNDELPYMTFVERLKDAITSTSTSRQRYQDEEPIINSRRPSQFS